MLVAIQKGARKEGGHPQNEEFFNQERPEFATGGRREERNKIDFTSTGRESWFMKGSELQ